MKGRRLVIALSGFHGTGKSTLARDIAERYELKVISSGMIFRRIASEKGLSLEELSRLAEESPEIDYMIDNRLKEFAVEGGIVADALLSGWMLRDIADIKIWLNAPLEIRIKRIADRENRDYDEILKETLTREESEIKRFKKYYDIDLNDLSVYDFIISTHPWRYEHVRNIVFKIIDGYLDSVGDGR
jgi:cytidylate kinase